MKILIVDDDPDLLAVTGFALQQAGFLVVKASDGVAALDAFHREQPDLAVLDINMPKMNGFELAQKLRERSQIPLIMLTVRSEEEDVVRALAIGADDYLSKPFSPRILLARVKALLRRVGMETEETLAFRSLSLDVRSSRFQGFHAGLYVSRRSRHVSCSYCSRMADARLRPNVCSCTCGATEPAATASC